MCNPDQVDDPNICPSFRNGECNKPDNAFYAVARAACPVKCGVCYTTTSTATITTTTTTTTTNPRDCAEASLYSEVNGKKPKRIKSSDKLPTENEPGWALPEGGSIEDCKKECAVVEGCAIIAIHLEKNQCHFYKNKDEIIAEATSSDGTMWKMFSKDC